jgi:hypothetical protein
MTVVPGWPLNWHISQAFIGGSSSVAGVPKWCDIAEPHLTPNYRMRAIWRSLEAVDPLGGRRQATLC